MNLKITAYRWERINQYQSLENSKLRQIYGLKLGSEKLGHLKSLYWLILTYTCSQEKYPKKLYLDNLGWNGDAFNLSDLNLEHLTGIHVVEKYSRENRGAEKFYAGVLMNNLNLKIPLKLESSNWFFNLVKNFPTEMEIFEYKIFQRLDFLPTIAYCNYIM